MKLSRIEANWIASKLLSDAERQREDLAQRQTAWLVILFPALKQVRPTERLSKFRSARHVAARDLRIMVPTVAGWVLFAALYIGIPPHSLPPGFPFFPATIVVANLLAQYARMRVLLRARGQ
jgi:hypothetical protein